MHENILFIGAGKLGTTLAKAMSEKGFSIPFFFSKRIPFDHEVYLPSTQFISELNKNNFKNINKVIITVPDDQIKNVAAHLILFDVSWTDKMVLHTSGCLSSDELRSLKIKGARVGSVHPMQTFNDHFLPCVIFRDIFFAVEGDSQIYNYFKKISEILDANVLKLNPEYKILYHIAAVASSNFFIALLDYISGIYKKLNFDEEEIPKLILPIINQTLVNFKKDELKNCLTGPLKRGDWNIIENHVNYLKKSQSELLPVYKEISKYISQFILKLNKFEMKKIYTILNK
jgi:predicted short-subunit dehydrogenase-like oxidoreductase (DUF2520 family)